MLEDCQLVDVGYSGGLVHMGKEKFVKSEY